MKTILTICPCCFKTHALCWQVRKSGRVIGVICSDKPVIRRNRAGDTQAVESTVFIPIKFTKENPQPENLDGIPEHYTPHAQRLAGLKGGLQFVLMHAAPGENLADSRAVDLPRAAVMQSDAIEAERLQKEIGQRMQAQKELDVKISKLDGKRRDLESEERELRKRLREVWTEPLDFTSEK